MNRDIDFSSYLYNRLPEVYRREDCRSDVNYALKRYLEALGNGGINNLFSEVLDLYDILDIEKTPEDVLPLWGKLFGYDYIHEVEPAVQRKILQNLIELYRRKGTKSAIEFITREFTSFDTQVIEMQYRMFKTWSPKPKNIPKDVYVEPRTLSSKGITNDTCYLLSSLKGMCNEQGIIIVVDAQGNQLGLLNRLLLEFMPIYCKIYLRVKNVYDKYTDGLSLETTDSEPTLKVTDRDKLTMSNTEVEKAKVIFSAEKESVNTSREDEPKDIERKGYTDEVNTTAIDGSVDKVLENRWVDDTLTNFTYTNTDTEREPLPPEPEPTV